MIIYIAGPTNPDESKIENEDIFEEHDLQRSAKRMRWRSETIQKQGCEHVSALADTASHSHSQAETGWEEEGFTLEHTIRSIPRIDNH